MTGKMAINRIGSPAGRGSRRCVPHGPRQRRPPGFRRQKNGPNGPLKKGRPARKKSKIVFPPPAENAPGGKKQGRPLPAGRRQLPVSEDSPPPSAGAGRSPRKLPRQKRPRRAFSPHLGRPAGAGQLRFPAPAPAQRRAAARGEKIPPAQSRRPGPGCSLRSLQPAQPAQPELPAQLEQSPQQRPRRRHAARSAAPTARRSRAVRNRSIGCIPSPPHSPSSSPA